MPQPTRNDVRFGATFLPGPPADFLSWCREAEAAGLDLVGIADSQSVYREAVVSATLCAQATQRVRLGPMVINPVTRHPAVAASAAATLAELAPGRVVLGIGTGDSAVHNLGLGPANLAGLREYVTAVRTLYAEGRADYRGAEAKLTWQPERVPVFVAASGPKTLELAGEIADGVVVLNGLLPEIVEDSRTRIAAGAARSGRTLDDLELWWFPWAALGDSREAAIETIKMSLASGAKHLARFTTQGKHIPEALEPKFHEVMRRYRFDEHQRPGGANVKLIEELGLVDYLADRMAIAGTPAECVRQIERAREAGAARFLMAAAFTDKIGFLRRWGAEVVPAFR